jgi:uncharacterized protein (TIGR02646 family)
MKYIHKRRCPHVYSQWCARVAGTAEEDFREVKGPEKHALLIALIVEQGALCAYTMKRIDPESAHVEHIKPQSLCRAERAGSDLDYSNLVACFPRRGMKTPYRYGAERKGDWWENGGLYFVSPLHPACEKRFRFDMEGKIAAVGNHAAAATSIRVLALDHPSLTEDRGRVIEEFLYGESGHDPLSQARATRAMASIREPYANGRFYEFCIAILHALQDHLKGLRRSARRRRGARRRT